MRILSICLVLISFSSFGQNIDIQILKDINLNRYKQFDSKMQFLTNTSDYTAIGLPVSILAVGFIKNDAAIKKEGFNLAVSTLGTYGVGYILKKSVNRTRPYVTYPYIQNYEKANDSSFPSGSTALAFSTATSLSMSYPKWYVIAPAALYAGGVAYSRLHLGAHYPSDVLAGAVLGAGSAFVSRQLNKFLVNNYRKRIVKKSTN